MEEMRVKHGTKIRFVVTTGGRALEESVIPVEDLGGAITRCGIMYNRLSMSGGVAWWDPATGYAIEKPKYTFDFINESDVLTGDQLCDCENCV